MTENTADSTALWAGPAPAPASPASASFTFAWRALLKIKHVPEQLGDVIGIPVMFTLLFTYLFGGALAGSTRDYLQFLLPGTLALAVIFVTVYSGVTLNRDLSTGAFDRFRSLPVWRAAPILGSMIGDVGRYLFAAALVLGLGFAMGYRAAGGVAGVLGALGLVIAFALALTCVWTALGLVLRTPNAVMNLGFVILFPVTFVSNVFVQPNTMPTWLRHAATVNPVTHVTNAVRDLMGGAPAAHEVGWVLIASVAIAAMFAPLTGWLYRRR